MRMDDIVFFNNELITSYKSERIPFNSIQLDMTKILWYDRQDDFPSSLLHSSNLSDHVSRALEVIELAAEHIFTIS